MWILSLASIRSRYYPDKTTKSGLESASVDEPLVNLIFREAKTGRVNLFFNKAGANWSLIDGAVLK